MNSHRHNRAWACESGARPTRYSLKAEVGRSQHVTRGRWSALEREQHIKRLAELDRDNLQRDRWVDYRVVIEQEPGSGGKESAEATIRNLAGFIVQADRVTGSKEVRADPLAAAVQGGNVWLAAGPWVEAFLEEAEAWPHGAHLDQIDAAAMAFSLLTAGPVFDLELEKAAWGL